MVNLVAQRPSAESKVNIYLFRTWAVAEREISAVSEGEKTILGRTLIFILFLIIKSIIKARTVFADVKLNIVTLHYPIKTQYYYISLTHSLQP